MSVGGGALTLAGDGTRRRALVAMSLAFAAGILACDASHIYYNGAPMTLTTRTTTCDDSINTEINLHRRPARPEQRIGEPETDECRIYYRKKQ